MDAPLRGDPAGTSASPARWVPVTRPRTADSPGEGGVPQPNDRTATASATTPSATTRSASAVPASETRASATRRRRRPAPRRTAPGRALAPRRRRWWIPVAIAGIVLVAVGGVGGAWLSGMFAPSMSRLPDRVGTYVLDSSTRGASPSAHDLGTYRTDDGDLYRATIVKEATDPAVTFAAASEQTRFRQDAVYCTGANADGMGGTCMVRLSTGAVAVVESSTRHAVRDVASFTAQLASGIR